MKVFLKIIFIFVVLEVGFRVENSLQSSGNTKSQKEKIVFVSGSIIYLEIERIKKYWANSSLSKKYDLYFHSSSLVNTQNIQNFINSKEDLNYKYIFSMLGYDENMPIVKSNSDTKPISYLFHNIQKILINDKKSLNLVDLKSKIDEYLSSPLDSPEIENFFFNYEDELVALIKNDREKKEITDLLDLKLKNVSEFEKSKPKGGESSIILYKMIFILKMFDFEIDNTYISDFLLQHFNKVELIDNDISKIDEKINKTNCESVIYKITQIENIVICHLKNRVSLMQNEKFMNDKLYYLLAMPVFNILKKNNLEVSSNVLKAISRENEKKLKEIFIYSLKINTNFKDQLEKNISKIQLKNKKLVLIHYPGFNDKQIETVANKLKLKTIKNTDDFIGKIKSDGYFKYFKDNMYHQSGHLNKYGGEIWAKDLVESMEEILINPAENN